MKKRTGNIWKHFSRIFVGALCLALVLCSCVLAEENEAQGSTETVSSNQPVEKLNIGMVQEFKSFNMVGGTGAMEFLNYTGFVMAQFVEKDGEGNLMPAIFQTWQISDDNTELTVTIPTTVEWHDGVPMTAEDVKFSLEYYRDVIHKGNLVNLEEVTINSEDTLTLKFSQPAAYGFLYNLFTMSTYVIPEHIWEGVEDPEAYIGEDAAVGCGPYRFISYDEASQTAHFEAVENYYKGEITVKSVDVHSYASEEALVMAMINGEIDAMYRYSSSLDFSMVPMLENEKDIDLGIGYHLGDEHMSFNMQSEICKDLKFRQAVSYAINYPLTVSVVSGEYGEIPGRGIIPPGNKGYDSSIEKLEYSPEEAMRILDEAGYVDQDGDGWRDCLDGSPMDISIILPASSSPNQTRVRLAEIVAENLKDIQVNSHLDEDALSDPDLARERLYNTKEYDLFVGYTTHGIALYNTVADYLVDTGKENGSGTFGDPEYVEIYNRLFTLSSDDEYLECVQKLQQIQAEQIPAVAFCWKEAIFPYRTDKYTGGEYYPGWGIINNKTWYNLVTK